MAGFSIVGAKVKDTNTTIRMTESRFHFGCGLDIKIADNLFLNTGFKYNKTDDERWSSDGFWFSVGMVMRFSSKYTHTENIKVVDNMPAQQQKKKEKQTRGRKEKKIRNKSTDVHYDQYFKNE